MPKLPSISPFMRVVLGLVLGSFAGLFFGEPLGRLEIFGDAYIRLLQMTVIPYVLVSLVGGLGGLDVEMARRIGTRGGGLILFVWATVLLSLVCVPLAYPNWTTASFFSTSLLAGSNDFDPLTLYLPANPFYSLANTIMPAVVLFSIALGLALIPIENKSGLLGGLRNVSDALMKMASFVGKLAPLGIFAIAAAAAGTLRLEEFTRLQVYIWTYLGIWSVIAFWTLPALIGRSTPLAYGDVLRQARTPMLTAFATGTVLVVLPMIAESCKALLEERDMDAEEARTTIDVLVPTAYSFPSAGTLLGLGFILYAAWYVGAPLTVDQYPGFTTVGALTAFGSMAVALPFMLDYFSLPADLFQLYLLGSVMTARFATGLAAMHGVVICLLGAMAMLGRLRLRALLEVAAISVGVTALLMTALGFVLTRVIPFEYQGDETLVQMELFGAPVPSKVVDEPLPLTPLDRARDRLDVAAERGSLRVGYEPNRLPYAYRDELGGVVGFDVDLVHALARDLGVSLEFSRLEGLEPAEALEDGRIDLLIGANAVTAESARRYGFSAPYTNHTLAFIVRDAERRSFGDLASIRALDAPRIGVGAGSASFQRRVAELVPGAELVPIAEARPFFRKEQDLDALVFSAEAGSAWTLIYPDFSVVVPEGTRIQVPAALALPPEQPGMERFVNTWLMLSERNGLFDELYRHWILGEIDTEDRPRWSIARDVLGWVD